MNYHDRPYQIVERIGDHLDYYSTPLTEENQAMDATGYLSLCESKHFTDAPGAVTLEIQFEDEIKGGTA